MAGTGTEPGGERGVARGSGDGHPRGPKAAEPRLPGRSGAVFAWLIRRGLNSGDQRWARKVFAKSGFGSAGSRGQTGVPAPRGFFSLPCRSCAKPGGRRGQEVSVPPQPRRVGPRAAPPHQPFLPKSHSQAGNKKQQHKERRGDLPLC